LAEISVAIFHHNLLFFHTEKKRVCPSVVLLSFIFDVGVFYIYIYIFVSLFFVLFDARRPSSDLPLAACHLFSCAVDVSSAWLRSLCLEHSNN